MDEERYAAYERACIMRESGESFATIARYLGVPSPTVRGWLVYGKVPGNRAAVPRGGRAEVDLALLRDAFAKSGLSASDVARRMGWYRSHDGRPDATRVERALGLRTERCSRLGRQRVRQAATWEMAERLCEALDVDPVEVGV